MGSSHFGELGLGNGRSSPPSSSSGTSRRGKKGSSSDKPRQPQRGLGVAQLERIRLQSQMASYLPSLHPPPPPFQGNLNKEEDVRIEMGFSSSSPSSSSSTSYAATSPSSSLFPLHPSTMMGFGEADQRRDTRYGGFQSSSPTRPFLHHNNASTPHHWGQQTVALPLFEHNMEDAAQKKRRHDRHPSTGSMSQNSDSSDTQELDLDLKL